MEWARLEQIGHSLSTLKREIWIELYFVSKALFSDTIKNTGSNLSPKTVPGLKDNVKMADTVLKLENPKEDVTIWRNNSLIREFSYPGNDKSAIHKSKVSASWKKKRESIASRAYFYMLHCKVLVI